MNRVEENIFGKCEMNMENENVPQRELTAESGMPARCEWVEMFVETFRYRELLMQMVLRDIRLRYKQAVMGFAWAICMPLLIVLSGFLVKFAMAHISGKAVELSSIAGMAVKAMVWSFFGGCVSFSSGALTGNMNLVTKIYFPREVLPLSAVLTQLFDSFIGATALSLMLVLFMGVTPSLSMLWAIPLVLMLFCFTLGLVLFISCANVFYRDVKYLAQVIIMFGIFFTPVFYEPIMFGPTGSRLMMLNPLTPIMEGLRLSTVGVLKSEHELMSPPDASASGNAAETPFRSVGVNLIHTLKTADGIVIWSPYYLLYSALWAFPGMFLAWLYFHRMEFILPEYI